LRSAILFVTALTLAQRLMPFELTRISWCACELQCRDAALRRC